VTTAPRICRIAMWSADAHACLVHRG
jgi:hypothetical protein